MRKSIVAAAVAAFALVGGIAYASIPDSNGVIHGCYKNSTGALSVIDSPSQSCASGETALSWSQTGPQGPTGATGATGATGPQGPAGEPGTDATSLWAVVSLEPTAAYPSGVVTSNSPVLERGSGVASVSYKSFSNWAFGGQIYLKVEFNQDVSGCSYSTSRGTADAAGYGSRGAGGNPSLVSPDANTTDALNWTTGDADSVMVSANVPQFDLVTDGPPNFENPRYVRHDSSIYLEVFC